MYKMIAFDFDGTVMNSSVTFIRAFQESLSPYAGHELTFDEITSTFGVSEPGTVKALVKNNWEQALKDFYRKYEEMHAAIAEPFDGILELISWLKEKDIKVALITGKGEETCQISLKKVGLEGVFPDVLCGVEEGPNKDQCMKFLMEKYHLDPQDFAYVGDSLKDVEACRKAGVACLAAAWSEDANVVGLEQANPGLVFQSIGQLQSYFNDKL